MLNDFNYEHDCDCIDICKSIDWVYNLCKEGASITSKRCSPAEKNIIFLLNKISTQLNELPKK